ncbi:MAG: 2-dehydro-3-deoxygalactonokinase [Cognatishimia sp.]|uniref:2-dehydro-3-deoxygalactonokinase n=1 Tax=Cognatishimia sp. 1_MG-2023 TaxID=3062642 RepID=UPI0026E225B7|nr:2-dehydro-3-deoxygalactonokinase [Cognatishimia sp. 1_MG-2023]MDO6727015.1 2-dehydro-3-deoxygalactonokinase [Cognatishimia sp. 1_MG-2023]
MIGTTRDNLALVAVDWGTSNLRLTLLGADGETLGERSSDRGMGSLEPSEFEGALLELIDEDLPEGKVTPIICCGMVGARQGWQEAPYLTTPCKPPEGTRATRATVADPRISVWVLPGVMQTGPADVMRGEETQIAGYLAENPDFDGVLCLPGTHTKWARISAGEIVSFQTFMTGEMFALLSKHSVLRHTVNGTDWDADAFKDAMSDAMSRPQGIAAKLFGLRADNLVGDMTPSQGKARLSGYLVGLELAGARPYWLGMEVALIGAPALSKLYQEGLAAQGVPSSIHPASDMTLSGLKAAYTVVKELN